MTRKERRFVIEGVAIVGALALLFLFVLPAMVSMHDSIAFIAAVLVGAGALGWLAYFIYRINQES